MVFTRCSGKKNLILIFKQSILKFSNKIAGLFLATLCLFLGCKDPAKSDRLSYFEVVGQTMGTTYSVILGSKEEVSLKLEIDSLLVEINDEVSTYIPTSTISEFNKANDTFDLNISFRAYSKNLISGNKHFLKNYLQANVVHQRTETYFDPTIMPLVNYWGFGYSGKKPVEEIDSILIDSLKQLVGFEKVKMITRADKDEVLIVKSNPNSQLDFSGIAKGYAVDEIASLLKNKGINNYLVEIGGETVSSGLNSKNQIWSIGINTPSPDALTTDYQIIVELDNKAIATSGDYRQFYEINGRKYSHIINPKTGFSEKSDLLSVSVIAENCLIADGYATAFFVMGREKGLKLANQLDGINALFIYGNEEGTMETVTTNGFEKMLKKSH